MTVAPVKNFPTLGCCGLDCGLCPRYYTEGSSRCPGCCGPYFYNKHPSCSYITCCVKKKGLVVCAQCDEFPCVKFNSWLEDGPEYDSFLTYLKVKANMDFIKQHGLEKFLKQQNERIRLLRIMYDKFDDGRSKSYFCFAATLLPISGLNESIENAEQKINKDNIIMTDLKARARILKEYLESLAAEQGVVLKLRKKVKS